MRYSAITVMIITMCRVLLLALACLAMTPQGEASTLLSPEPAFYDRLARLENPIHPDERGRIVATATAPAGGMHVDVFKGDSDGVSFSLIGKIVNPAFATGLCCGTVYELPRQIGALPPGTLLWAGAVGARTAAKRMAIKVFRSEDDGASWSYLSEVTTPNAGGLWEPEFTVAADGALVMFFSDETEHPQYGQTLKKVRTHDGLNWQDMAHVVASRIPQDRPGMAVVRRLSGGRWMMTYELGGPAQFIVRYRLSNDGWNWGDAQNVGTEIRLPTGAFPAHAPTFTVTSDGAIVLTAQLIENPDLTLSPLNGRVLLINQAGRPATPWTTISAPVPVPGACSESCRKRNWCPNYSSPLLPSDHGRAILEFASHWTNGRCLSSYGVTQSP
jgi:hypothetical protein